MRSATTISVTLLLGALTGCSGSSDTADDASANPVAAIQTVMASSGGVTQRAALYGTAEPASGGDAAVAVPMEATVTRLLVSDGAHVGAGQAIAVLSASPTGRLDLARAGVDTATTAAALARAERLRSDGLMSDADVEAARAAARAAALTRDSLAVRARALTLRAPLAGYVEGLTAHVGDLLAVGAPLTRVVDGSQLRARFGIDLMLARRAHAGMPVRITVPGRGATLTTTVQSVDPVIDPATRQASLIAQLPRGSGIAPGEIVRASLEIAGTAGSVNIPYAALLDDGGTSYIFVIVGNIAHRREVTIGQAQGDSVAITAGLKAGERVAVTGGTALDDGMKIRDIGQGAPK